MSPFGKSTPQPTSDEPPKLARRSANHHSVLKTGRTLSARREHIETSSERAANRQKLKRREHTRIVITVIGFLAVTALVIGLGVFLAYINSVSDNKPEDMPDIIYKPTIEVIDEDAGSNITGRMSQYIGQAEADLREYGLIAVKAIIPAGAIREIDFYLDGHSGYIKMTLDRDTSVSAEDASRMIHYLEEGQGITDYQYIDVRLSGQAYWK